MIDRRFHRGAIYLETKTMSVRTTRLPVIEVLARGSTMAFMGGDTPHMSVVPGWAVRGHSWPFTGDNEELSSPPDDDESDEDDDDDEAPETPLDEPRPIPVQDPPAEPDQHPYTVSAPAG
jgi:hypothetical protein